MRKIKLTLFDWPPVASHFAAIIFGVSMTYLFSAPKRRFTVPKTGQIVVSLPRSLMPAEAATNEDVIIIHETEAGSCRVDNAELRVLQLDENIAAMEVALSHSDAVLAELKKIKDSGGRFKLSLARYGESLIACRKNPTIVFGANG